MAIHFYHPDGPFGFLSNFSPHAVEAEARAWPTAEHLFQALKFPHDPERRERILRARTAAEAKRIAWEEDAVYPADWFARRGDVMLGVLRLKFRQHADLAARLAATGDEALVESGGRDTFWGIGHEGEGLNTMGRLLMRVRTELRGSQA